MRFIFRGDFSTSHEETRTTNVTTPTMVKSELVPERPLYKRPKHMHMHTCSPIGWKHIPCQTQSSRRIGGITNDVMHSRPFLFFVYFFFLRLSFASCDCALWFFLLPRAGPSVTNLTHWFGDLFNIDGFFHCYIEHQHTKFNYIYAVHFLQPWLLSKTFIQVSFWWHILSIASVIYTKIIYWYV